VVQVQGKIKGRFGRAAAAASLAVSLLVAALPVTGVAAAACLSTGVLDRDGTPLTAKLVNPSGTVSGPGNGPAAGLLAGGGRHRVP
jgi:hypothetical protein